MEAVHSSPELPACGSCSSLKRPRNVWSDPAAIEVSFLRDDAFTIDRAIEERRVEGNGPAQILVARLGLVIAPRGVDQRLTHRHIPVVSSSLELAQPGPP